MNTPKMLDIVNQTKEVTVSMGQTVQIVQYEPRNYHVSLKIEVKEGQDVNAIIKLGERIVAKNVQDYVTYLKEGIRTARSKNLTVCSHSGCGRQIDTDTQIRTEEVYGTALCDECEAKYGESYKVMKEGGSNCDNHLNSIKEE
jgi:hypothetical protein